MYTVDRHYHLGVAGLDDATFLVLHEVRLRGVVDLDETVEVTELIAIGYVTRSARGVRITSRGREEHTVLARVLDADVETAARRAYERFLPLNRELLRICNDWQVRPGSVPNDHRDARYDFSVIDRVHALDERAGPIASRLGRSITRFESYRPRLRAALARIDNGDTEWLTSPRRDSYHTVWMQFHEDLLLALGAERAAEPDA